MARSIADRPRPSPNALPRWIKPQLTRLVDAPPDTSDWLHQIKFDGYRLHARLDRGSVRLLTRTGLDWTQKFPTIASAIASLPAKQSYLDGEVCGVRLDGTKSFTAIQAASDAGNSGAFVFFLFDRLYLDGEMIASAPLINRKTRLQELLRCGPQALQFSDHQIGRGSEFYTKACEVSVEGIISKRIDAPYAPGNRRLWVKTKMPEPRGVRRRRLDRSGGLAAVLRRTSAGVLHSGRSTGVCRARGRRH